MAGEKTIHGRIDCPCCGAKDGVRITADKNGHPFGFCDANCGLQIRIGGDAFRLVQFNKRYQAIAASMGFSLVTVTEPKPALAPTEKQKNKGFSLEDL